MPLICNAFYMSYIICLELLIWSVKKMIWLVHVGNLNYTVEGVFVHHAFVVRMVHIQYQNYPGIHLKETLRPC